MGTRTRVSLASAFLIAVTAAVFSRVVTNEFVVFDTSDYVLENEVVLRGLTGEGVAWAFTEFHIANWHPLTWLSHMLDVELFGLNAAAHHLVNVGLHAFSAVLLLLVFHRATGDLGPSLFVALVFAIHPLHVESVAWVAERKDVLSTFFAFAALWWWVLYTERPGPLRYGATLVLLALGLMAKSMLVTLPCVMLLLDFWPLGRVGSVPARRLLLEKLPFFALVLASCAVTIAAQKSGGAVKTLGNFSLGMRLENSSVAYVTYAWKTLWPTDLAVWYPHPRDSLATWSWIAACAGLALATVSAVLVRRRAPYVLTGWLWFLGTLVPVIGLVQVGGQAWADRYAYIPQTGLAIIVAWGGRALLTRWRPVSVVLAAGAVAAMAAATWSQLARWRNTETLFLHTVRVTESNYVAHNVLGLLQVEAGALKAGIAQFRMALLFAPSFVEAHNNLGRALIDAGDPDAARQHFESGIRHMPTNADAHHQLGILYGMDGETEKAELSFRKALELEPSAQTYFNLGLELGGANRFEEAIDAFFTAIALRPGFTRARVQLGLQLMKLRRFDEAVGQLETAVREEPENADARYFLAGAHALAKRDREAVEQYEWAATLRPDWPAALGDLAFVLATTADDSLRDPTRALELADRARELTDGKEANILDTLAAAQAADGRYEEATATARAALDLARETNRPSLAGRIESRIELYDQGRPYRAE